MGKIEAKYLEEQPELKRWEPSKWDTDSPLSTVFNDSLRDDYKL